MEATQKNRAISVMPIVPATAEWIARAAEALRTGRLVAFPTETVYGLGADATRGEAVAGIFAAKERPRFNPLIVHVTDVKAAERLGRFSELDRQLAAAFWPGGLTLVVPKQTDCPVADLTTAGLATVGLRVPSHPIAQALLREVALPIAGPSANRSGHVSPTLAAHVAADLGDAPALILDGGATPHGIESTVVMVRGPDVVLLRPGAVTAEAIERVTGRQVLRDLHEEDRPSSPGQLASHYAPRAAVRLNAQDVRAGEALLAFGPDVPAHGGMTINLSARGDLIEAAANLFMALRALDASGAQRIAAMPIPGQGLGEAINDRLRRAAAPRPG
jgi:L-threonylcarbamoyladenylate synthase